MAIADHPPHRSVLAELPHTAPPLDSSVETNVGIGMKSTWTRNPSIKDRPQLFPVRLPPLTPTAQNTPPGATEPFSKSPEYGQVARNSMVSAVALHHAFQPRSDQHNRLMHLPAQLLLDGQELCPQSFCRCPPPDHKMALRVPTTIVGEPEKRESFRFSLSALPSIRPREASQLDQSRLLRNGSPVQTSPAVLENLARTALATRDFLPPDLGPQVENIVQIHVREQR